MSYNVTAITQAANAAVTINSSLSTNPLAVGQVLLFASVGGMTQINGLTGVIAAVGGSTTAWTATVQINSSAFSAYTSGGTVVVVVGIPISQLPSAGTITGTELVPVVQGGITSQSTAAAIVSAAQVGMALYPRTAGEIAAGVTPSNFAYSGDFIDPRRYGVLGNGTNETSAMNIWVSVVNATINPVSTWPIGFTVSCGTLNTITAANFTWNCFSTLLSAPNSVTGANQWITINSTTLRLYGLAMNGNQANYSAAVGNAMLYLNGTSDLLIDGCSFINSWNKAVLFYQVSGGRINNSHFDSNAGAGIETNAASYLKFVNSTVNYNGYGFQKTLATNTFLAFGSAIRYRSHHLIFTACEAKQNGRDGFNTNQGSYSIKYDGCLAWMNGDGGFTLASDSTGSGLPGEGEVCQDSEYVDCESYNNLSSGLSAYAPAYNVTIDGGRYYNNNRTAGLLSPQSSYMNGVYFAAGSIGINVKTKAYDDRQFVPITGASGTSPRVLTATGWVAGSAVNYPRVALYDSAMTFQGYGTITAESAGSVSITTTPFAGATIATIVGGWFVTQRVQHNGVFFDNNCQGTIEIVDAFGHRPGGYVPGGYNYSGYKAVSGFTNNGQNVTVPAYTLDPNTELLINPSWDTDETNWTFNTPGGGSHARVTGGVRRSTGAEQLIGGSSVANADATLNASALQRSDSAWVEFSMWVYASNPGDASILLFFGTGPFNTSVNHPGGGVWELLRIGAFMGPGNATLIARIQSSIGKTNYFDDGSLRVKNIPYDNRDFTYPTRNLAV